MTASEKFCGHWIEPIPTGSRVTVSIRLEGLLSPIVSWLARKLNASYLDLEAKGLKARSENSEFRHDGRR